MAFHVHIGPGRFGLGFVGPFARDFNYPLVLLNRLPRDPTTDSKIKIIKQQRKYFVRYFNNIDEDEIPVHDVHTFSIGGDDTGESIAAIANPETVLITTSVGYTQLSEAAPLIYEGLSKRGQTGSPVYIIACENGNRPSDRLKQEVQKYTDGRVSHDGVFLNCVADRICYGYLQKKDAVAIEAEHYREWVIGSTEQQLIQLFQHPAIKVVPDEQLTLYEKRKLWLLNGTHLALAVLGSKYLDHHTEISKVLTSQNDVLQEFIRGVKGDLARIFIHYDRNSIFGGPDEVEQSIDSVLERFQSSHDMSERVLREVLFDNNKLKILARTFAHDLGKDIHLSDALRNLLPSSFFSFFQKVRERLYDPLAFGYEKRTNPEYLAYVIQELIPFFASQGENL